MLQSGLTPLPPIVTKNTMYFFSETRPLLGHFLKKSVFHLIEMSKSQNQQKMAKYGNEGLPNSG